MKRETVRISTPAGEIEAWIYYPDTDQPRPAIILGCGVGAVKAAGLAPFAEEFCKAGYIAVAFDYLGFGGSGGSPRHVVIVWDEYRDFKAVVDWTKQQKQVSSVSVWGTSFGGMHVTRMLAEDRSIAAGIAQCPCVDAAKAARMKPLHRSIMLTFLALLDWVCGFFMAPIYVYAAQSTKGDRIALMDAPDVPTGWALLHKDVQSRGKVDPHSNRIAARSVLSFPFSRPALRAHLITAPYLIVVPEVDTVAPLDSAIEVTKKAAKGELVQVPGGHFDLYKDGIGYKKNLAAQLAFLKRVVPI